MTLSYFSFALISLSIVFIILMIVKSIVLIGSTETGLVIKRLAFRKLKGDDPIAFRGEAGYQAQLLSPGLRFKLWPIFKVEKFPWVQVPAGEIGVVIAQVGKNLPTGAKSATYKNIFGQFQDLKIFIDNGGQKGVQRPVLNPGYLGAIHPVAFTVITASNVYGKPINKEIAKRMEVKYNMSDEKLRVTQITPSDDTSVIGIVTTHDGDPLEKSDIANRIGGYEDIKEMEEADCTNGELVETILSTKNGVHNNYQDFQSFIDNGGKIGLQHDPLLRGTYLLNPFLVSVEIHEMLVVEQGEVAVIKSYVGLVTQDTSGEDFKFGSIVRPGHRGIWQEALRTGKYAINPRCYKPIKVSTSILTLNWAETNSRAHDLDEELSQITAKSKEGFEFNLDLQVQIHVSDTQAPRVISMVGSMENLVNEVLQAAVGNHFRDKLQSLKAIQFIEERNEIQETAQQFISEKLKDYNVETRGVYIQDVILPNDIVAVLTEREIASQQIATFKKQEEAENQRIAMEKTKGEADMQSALASSKVNIDIKKNTSDARILEAKGEATYISETGKAHAARVEAEGLAKAKGYREQVAALGADNTARINIASLQANATIKLPQTLSISSSEGNANNDLISTVVGSILAGNKIVEEDKPVETEADNA